MVGVRLQGRLGNQLFQFAFIYAVSKYLDTTYFIDQHIERFILPDYFNIPSSIDSLFSRKVFKIRGYKNFFNFHLRRWLYPTAKRLKYTKNFGPFETFDTVYTNLNDETLYEGFFQSEYFFNNHLEEILKMFEVRQELSGPFKDQFKREFAGSRTVAVHIRRGDYLNVGGTDITLPAAYYHKLVQRLNASNITFIFVTDDPAFVNREFVYLPNKFVSGGDEITDLQYMINADTCVIANSTFSWWGAYLNNNPEKKVYAPAYFLGWREKQISPPEIYPQTWTIVEIDA